jgi:cytoskeleton protein RodZ
MQELPQLTYAGVVRKSRISVVRSLSGESPLPSFGEKLRLEREKRAVTLEQISLSTKIGTRMLQALEANKFNQLPGGIFNNGFVRAYARCLGLDEDQTVADYLQAAGEAAPTHMEAVAEPEIRIVEERPAAPSRDLPWGLFAAALLIVALALSFWSYRKREHPEQKTSRPAPRVLQEPMKPAASTAGSEGSPAPTNDLIPASSPQPSAPSKVIAPETVVAQPSAPAKVTGGFSVTVEARENSWVTLTVDGKTVLSDLLLAGTQKGARGHEDIIVRAGNIGGLDIFFNGKKVPPQGGSGEVKTLTFGPAGLTAKEATPQVVQ